MFKKTAGSLLALILLAGINNLPAQEDTFDWSNRMGAGQVLEVKGIVGSIHAVLASGDQAEVVARKRGRRGDFEEVAIEVEETGDGFVICAVYGSWNHGEGHCLPNRRDRNEDRERHRDVDIDVDVEFEVRVPAGVEFQGNMVSGGIEVEDLRSRVEVGTVSGDISVSSSEMVWANSVAGDIEVEMGNFDWEDLEFSTVSGDITLWLPDDFGADIDFNSLSGDLHTDFDLTVRSQRNRRWIGTDIEGTIGGGGRDLSINTVSGDVELRRRSR
ncbi:MAG: DUF4097 family beta strand repeat-containing protein [Longimicrobiales bacterium]